MIYAFCDSRLNDIFSEASDILDACKVPYSDNIINIKVDNSKSRWGLCHRTYDGDYTITLSDKLFKGSHDGILSTMLHEMIHTAPDCMKHTGDWKRYAKRVNVYLNKPNFIKRCNDAEEKGIAEKQIEKDSKYIIQCPKCGYKWHRERYTKIIAHPENFSCPTCHETLIRVK